LLYSYVLDEYLIVLITAAVASWFGESVLFESGLERKKEE
jgi:hypothetical protein